MALTLMPTSQYVAEKKRAVLTSVKSTQVPLTALNPKHVEVK
jgi:hypothetical protein